MKDVAKLVGRVKLFFKDGETRDYLISDNVRGVCANNGSRPFKCEVYMLPQDINNQEIRDWFTEELAPAMDQYYMSSVTKPTIKFIEEIEEAELV